MAAATPMLQVILEYLDKKTRAMQQQNKIASWLMCLVRGLMWLLEKIVAFINRNAFILVAGGCRRELHGPHTQACNPPLYLLGPASTVHVVLQTVFGAFFRIIEEC